MINCILMVAPVGGTYSNVYVGGMYIAMCVRTIVVEGVAVRIVDSCLGASPQRNQAAISTAGNTWGGEGGRRRGFW